MDSSGEEDVEIAVIPTFYFQGGGGEEECGCALYSCRSFRRGKTRQVFKFCMMTGRWNKNCRWNKNGLFERRVTSGMLALTLQVHNLTIRR